MSVTLSIGQRFIRVLLCLVALSSLCAHAQSAIQGSVTDSTGAMIPGADISVTNTATGVSIPSKTNDRGLYTVSSLQPGVYTVTASPVGFAPASHSNITLHVSDNLVIDFALRVGSETSQVTVLTQVPLINTSSSSPGQVIENPRIVDLPLDGRDPIALAGLSTGVTPVPPNANVHQGTIPQALTVLLTSPAR